MKNKLFFAFFTLICALTLKAQIKNDQVKPFSIGEIRTIKSAVLGENRTLNIYLPENYDKNKSYPVIYLLDGSANEDFLHIVGIIQFFKMTFKMPDFIVVGIANVDRRRDFTFPTQIKKDKESYPTTGSSEKFIKFIETELQPFVQKTYKTTDTKYLIGQSLGGLLAVEILLKNPDLFSHYFIVSPSLWWDNESLLKEAKSLLDKQKNAGFYVYISVGAEGAVMEKDAQQLTAILRESNKKLRVDFLPLPKENHATILHQSIYEAFKIQFPYSE